MSRRALAFASVLGGVAAADETAIDVQLENQKVLVGRAQPTVVIQVSEPVSSLRLNLTRSDGRALDLAAGALRPGAARRFALDQPVGAFTYRGTLTAVVGKRRETVPVEFEAVVARPPKLEVLRDRFDLAARTVVVAFDRPAARAEIRVENDLGGVVADQEIALAGDAPGSPVALTWAEGPGTVMKIALRVFDAHGFYDGVELYPWRVDIPHEEVHFATDSARIDPAEAPKLDASYATIAEVVSRRGKLAPIRLYVAGHTDTVGTPEHNQRLSEARARAIGESFRRRGVKIPVFYDGFGENALFVSTADETDEVKNRRAEYIVAVEDPPIKNATVVPRWKVLR